MTSFVTLRPLLALSCVATLSLSSIQCTKSDPVDFNTPLGGAENASSGDGDGDTVDDDNTGGSPSGDDDETSTGGQANARCPADGEIFCFGECLVANTDENCGACGHSCGAGSTCQDVGGEFTCACPDGLIRCAAACIAPDTHPRYCGASGACASPAELGVNCGEGGACVDGGCLCDEEHTKCDNKCVDTDSDPEYCGTSPDECGTPCKTNSLCDDGSCACPANTTDCSDGCFDTNSAAEACGGCADSGGVVCDTDKGQECRDGSCECPLGWTLCGDTCRDLASDPVACGACDNSCSGGTPACHEGSCVSGPCDAAVTPACDGITLRSKSNCPESDDHFSGAGFKCLEGVPSGKDLCYQFDSSSDYEKFRCWWSGRSMNVNGTSMTCNSGGDLYQDVPSPQAGGYCVHIPSSTTPGAESDGFALGRF